MLVHMTAKLRKPDNMSNEDFYSVWFEEAKMALEVTQGGMIVGQWKVAGLQEVIVVMEVEDAGTLEEILLEFPIFKTGNSHILESLDYRIVTPYTDWARRLQKMVEGFKQ